MGESYSPLRYPGGKAQLCSFLIRVLQDNDLVEPHYVEPYAGGAGAALRLLFEEYVASITINDVDPRIRCFWQAAIKHNDSFVDLVQSVELSVEEWRRQRAIYAKCDLRKVLELGFATFFLNRTSRSGIIHNAGPIGGYDQCGNYKIDARFNRTQLIRRIRRLNTYAERINISGDDGLALLKRINRSPANAKHTFVYLDPPYYGKGAELYLNRFTHDQHAQLAKYLGSPKHFPWIMTYDDLEPIRRFYTGFSQVRFTLSYSAFERRDGHELLIHPTSIHVTNDAMQSLPRLASNLAVDGHRK